MGDKKNGVICLVIMFASEVMVIKMSKMADLLYFLLIAAKNNHDLGRWIWQILLSSFKKWYALGLLFVRYWG